MRNLTIILSEDGDETKFWASTKSVDVTNLRAVMKRTKTQRSRQWQTSCEDNGSSVRHLVRTMEAVSDILGGQWEQWQTSCEDNGSSVRHLVRTMGAVSDIFQRITLAPGAAPDGGWKCIHLTPNPKKRKSYPNKQLFITLDTAGLHWDNRLGQPPSQRITLAPLSAPDGEWICNHPRQTYSPQSS
uniref:Uncharacterized protein n=1 Tax=Timema shepardi TaxID=629360 RepID=A0A7R9APT1_TIMSH|nr:unnamed protein product [Timema shepardi]